MSEQLMLLPLETANPCPFPQVPDPQTRLCQGCGKETRIAKLHDHHPEGEDKRRVCASCAAVLKIDASEKRKVKKAKERFSDLMQVLHQARTPNAPNYVRYVTSVIEEMGGPDRLAAYTAEQVKAAGANKPGGKIILDALFNLSKMIAASQPMVNEMPDTLLMSNEELNKQMIEDFKIIALGELIEKIPGMRELVLAAAGDEPELEDGRKKDSA